jgi:hypothetical protein
MVIMESVLRKLHFLASKLLQKDSPPEAVALYIPCHRIAIGQMERSLPQKKGDNSSGND